MARASVTITRTTVKYGGDKKISSKKEPCRLCHGTGMQITPRRGKSSRKKKGQK